MTANRINRSLITTPNLCADVLVAAQELGSRHNISEIARLRGVSPVILANKLNPDCDSNHLSIGEAVSITELTNDNGILNAWALSRGQCARTEYWAGLISDDQLPIYVRIPYCRSS